MRQLELGYNKRHLRIVGIRLASSKMELYAAEVFRLQEYHQYVPLSALAQHMDVSLQAASGMIARMQQAGIVAHVPYKGVRLTPDGERASLLAIRRHRIIEIYLVRVMGFGWDEVHHLTDDLHGGVNQALEDRMFEMAGKPTRCPHGEPIPDSKGRMPMVADTSLVNLEANTLSRISRVRANEPEKLRYFAELGLRPGAVIQVVSRSPFNGPVRIRAGDIDHILGHDLAAKLWVESPVA